MANLRSLDVVGFDPHVIVDISTRNAEISVFGVERAPYVIALTGVAGLVWHDGEVELEKAAAAAGMPFCVSTQSIMPVERIAEGPKAGIRFQLYVWRSRARWIW